MLTASGSLSLADIEQFDPHPLSSGGRRRYLCPWCGGDKPQDTAHRCLSVDADEGVYICFRCGSKGRLGGQAAFIAHRSEQELEAIRVRKEQQRVDRTIMLERELDRSLNLIGTAGDYYLKDRGISLDNAVSSGVRYGMDGDGRAAVLFPLRRSHGATLGVQRRYLDKGEPRMKTLGFPKEAIFIGHLAYSCTQSRVAITEAPMDALSLEEMGFPAVSCCGSGFPDYLPTYLYRTGFKNIYVASDADGPGDRAAEDWAARLNACGLSAQRLRPEGVKDWNDYLTTIGGREALLARLQNR